MAAGAGGVMKMRYPAGLLILAFVALAFAGSTASGGTRASKATTITVWLQVDAQQAWPEAVASANRAFEASHPDTKVKVEYQTWGNHLTKLDAVLAGGETPDVVEMGNTETTKYMAAGAFADITSRKGTLPNSKTWLQGLKASCTFGGKLYCVPYYAGARAVIYRKDLYAKAGIKGTPRTLAQFVAQGKKLMKSNRGDSNFSALYLPGKYWYAAMSFVYDYGGRIAVKKGGKWKGSLDSPQARQALKQLKTVVNSLSRADKTGDEAKQDAAFAQGHIASVIANGWEWGVITDAKAGDPKLEPVLGAYPMPSHKKGQFMPTFLGGSDLAVPVNARNRQLGIDWIKAFTSSATMRQMATAGGVIPNTTSLVSINRSNPKLAPFAAAAKASWFVPTAPNWVNVESANVIPNMLVAILTGRSSVAKATTSASRQISQILNASS
jgi:N,N'-diacetylchitobiose transport system substrate-binding protein